jgi:hypothetical protein
VTPGRFGVAHPDRSRHALTGQVRGELHEWVRSSAGWLGLVEFELPGFVHRFRHLVPARALRPRDDNRTVDGRRLRGNPPTH